MTDQPDDAPAEPATRTLRLLQAAALLSNADRFAITPLLVVVAAGFGQSLAGAASVAGAYFLTYGLMQPVWGIVSDRIGRVRVMRLALIGAALGGIGSVLAPSLPLLVVARAVAGGSFAALIPTTLVYVGDAWPAAVRQRPLSDVLAASSVGIAVSMAGAGVLADLVGWRAVFAVTGLAAVALWFALARLPEVGVGRGPVPARGEAAPPTPLRSIRTVLGTRWAQFLYAVVFVEGVVLLGVLTYLAPAAQSLGTSATVAGLVAAAYGVGSLLFARVVRRMVGRVPSPGIAAIGGAFLVAAWLVPAVWTTVTTIAVAAVLVGGSWAFLHSTLQTWATEVVPHERATAVALFAALLFLGSAAGTALFAPAADIAAFGTVFVVAACAAVPVAGTAAFGRRRYVNRAV